jgi:hypothetical protein
MKKAVCITALLGSLLLSCTAFAQSQSAQPAVAPEPFRAVGVVAADQQPTKEQLAKLFEVMRLREQMQNMMKAVPSMVQQQIQAQAKEMAAKNPGGAPTAEQQAAIEKVLNKYMEKAFSIYTADEMIADMGTIYQRHLSRADIDAFIAFYASPAGQHLLDITPVIMQEYMPMVMNRVQERGKALNDGLAKDMAEIIKSQSSSAEKPVAK